MQNPTPEKCERCGKDMQYTNKGVIYCSCWMPTVVDFSFSMQPCLYCGGNCPQNELDGGKNLCDGFSGDIDKLYEGKKFNDS